MLPLNLSDTAATGQDGSSLEFIAAIAGRQCYIQDASVRGLCDVITKTNELPELETGRIKIWGYHCSCTDIPAPAAGIQECLANSSSGEG